MTDKSTKNLIRWLGFPTDFDFRKWRKLGVVTGCLLGVIFFTALFISAIQFFNAAFGASTSPTIHADARNYALILAALLSIPFVIWRVLIAHKQANIAEQGLITDRINKAVEQLGAEKTVWTHGAQRTVPNLEVRLGAIYALERIAQDSLRDHIPVMEILCAYVRHNAPAEAAHKFTVDYEQKNWKDLLRLEIVEIPAPPIDIQAIMTVIGRRKVKHINYERDANSNSIKRNYRLDFGRTNLQKIDLSSLNLENCNLEYSNMQGAVLIKTKIRKANIGGGDLRGVNLSLAELQEANLSFTKFQLADFSGAKVNLVAVRYTALSLADNLTEDQLKSMFGNDTSILPKHFPLPPWATKKLNWYEFHEQWQAAKAAANL